MVNILNAFNKKLPTNNVANDMRSIQPEKMFFKGIFLKQNLLGFFSCLFVLLFSNILKTVMFSKVFNLQHQLFLVLFFSLSMAFLALMLFQLKFNILRW